MTTYLKDQDGDSLQITACLDGVLVTADNGVSVVPVGPLSPRELIEAIEQEAGPAEAPEPAEEMTIADHLEAIRELAKRPEYRRGVIAEGEKYVAVYSNGSVSAGVTLSKVSTSGNYGSYTYHPIAPRPAPEWHGDAVVLAQIKLPGGELSIPHAFAQMSGGGWYSTQFGTNYADEDLLNVKRYTLEDAS